MPLSAGARVGPYEIVALIGVGGMGEVYRAHDPSLGRDVALKILPEAVASSPDRRTRFDREARLLASLNQPNIAVIHGLVQDGPTTGLVLELVEGPTLAERLSRGPLPAKEALQIARQIADALEAAHDKGVVHRDLKPHNIKIRPDGVVKVLDFGLAKLVADDESGDAATIGDLTSAGMVMGTAAYMSPEQASGQAVDKRADAWAFGCVLYEMVTGRRAFGGETTSDTLAAVLSREPDWSALPPSTPAGIRRLLVRCLEKDPRRRLREVGDSRFEIEEALGESGPTLQAALGPTASAPVAPTPKRRWPVLAVGMLMAAVALVALWYRPSPSGAGRAESPRVTPLTTYTGNEFAPSLSPDGSQVAFTWNGTTGANEDIYVLQIGAESPLRLTTDEASDRLPAWSPDGRQIAFVRRTGDQIAIFLIPPVGGSERKLADFTAAVAARPSQRFAGDDGSMLA